MATLIPILGELTELHPPKDEDSLCHLLGSPGAVKRLAPDGSSWWLTQPSVLSENDRATRFYNSRFGRTADFEILFGDVVYLSADETRTLAGVAAKDDYVAVRGRTFDVKEKLKSIGARWYPNEKMWKVPKDRLVEADDIVRKGP